MRDIKRLTHFMGSGNQAPSSPPSLPHPLRLTAPPPHRPYERGRGKQMDGAGQGERVCINVFVWRACVCCVSVWRGG